jgi:hypothetical protein
MSIRIARLLLLLCTAAFLNVAFAQAEPTLDQVYKAVQAGQLIQAQEMMKQVLRDHPRSAKGRAAGPPGLPGQGSRRTGHG